MWILEVSSPSPLGQHSRNVAQFQQLSVEYYFSGLEAKKKNIPVLVGIGQHFGNVGPTPLGRILPILLNLCEYSQLTRNVDT